MSDQFRLLHPDDILSFFGEVHRQSSIYSHISRVHEPSEHMLVGDVLISHTADKIYQDGHVPQKVLNNLADGLAVAIDQALWESSGTSLGAGLDVISRDHHHHLIEIGSLSDLGAACMTLYEQIPEEDRGLYRWIMNSMVGLEVARAKYDGVYIVDHHHDELRTVGVPTYLKDSPILYNEWGAEMERSKWPIVYADPACIELWVDPKIGLQFHDKNTIILSLKMGMHIAQPDVLNLIMCSEHFRGQ